MYTVKSTMRIWNVVDTASNHALEKMCLHDRNMGYIVFNKQNFQGNPPLYSFLFSVEKANMLRNHPEAATTTTKKG